MSKTTLRRLTKSCAVCGKPIKVIIYKDRSYRGGLRPSDLSAKASASAEVLYEGGHYFGRIPLYSKKQMDQIVKAKTRPVKIDGFTLHVLIRDPKPYAYAEYWECQKCYRDK